MSLLHSFYCWGHVGVVLLSTAFFAAFGIENWRYLTLLWAGIPVLNIVLFSRAPICSLTDDRTIGCGLLALFRMPIFLAADADDALRRCERAGGQPMGIYLCRKGAWRV